MADLKNTDQLTFALVCGLVLPLKMTKSLTLIWDEIRCGQLAWGVISRRLLTFCRRKITDFAGSTGDH